MAKTGMLDWRELVDARGEQQDAAEDHVRPYEHRRKDTGPLEPPLEDHRDQAEASPCGEIADREYARRDMGMAGITLFAIDRRE